MHRQVSREFVSTKYSKSLKMSLPVQKIVQFQNVQEKKYPLIIIMTVSCEVLNMINIIQSSSQGKQKLK